jgi:hypothetical protein
VSEARRRRTVFALGAIRSEELLDKRVRWLGLIVRIRARNPRILIHRFERDVVCRVPLAARMRTYLTAASAGCAGLERRDVKLQGVIGCNRRLRLGERPVDKESRSKQGARDSMHNASIVAGTADAFSRADPPVRTGPPGPSLRQPGMSPALPASRPGGRLRTRGSALLIGATMAEMPALLMRVGMRMHRARCVAVTMRVN